MCSSDLYSETQRRRHEIKPGSIERVFTDGFREFMQFQGNSLDNPNGGVIYDGAVLELNDAPGLGIDSVEGVAWGESVKG